MPTAIQADHFRQHSIRPALTSLGLWSQAAEELLLGTALHESQLRYRRQLGGGPARGLFQMEPATHNDIWNNFLVYHKGLGAQVKALKTTPDSNVLSELENNDRYAAAMARVHYRRAPALLPAAGDLPAMAAYWKKYYNTVYGAGTVQQYIDDWKAVYG